MIFEVEMWMFEEGKIREVNVPDHEIANRTHQNLDLVFKYGQNDFQPQKLPSVSTGDVIRYENKRYMVMGTGFKEVTEETDPANIKSREERALKLIEWTLT